ncbi:Gfo/Idh/MocA family protein [uncultured Nocardioides sp.]|uniref:Gfo/Idh/MocA family protein n=1 Tax=uncultured Nocardioides sp. TaxID=198441 RepID=UPI0025E01CF4|nr:Gfo/Idh/MocA family oxidoreductase [uncultured Nocardioides sp.]
MTTPSLGVAVIGHAFMGKAHSHAWRNVGAFFPEAPRVRQQVLVGRDPARVTAAARDYGWTDVATEWTTVLDRDDVDIVDVCVPGHLHAEIALAALAAGKHVLVEKPLANTVKEAEQLAAAAAEAHRHGVVSMVGFNYRRVPALALARRLVAEGRLGVVREVRAAYLQDWLADDDAPMSWRLRQDTAGSGALGDLGSHVVDLVRHLLDDEVASVSGDLHTFTRERSGPDGVERVTVDDAAWAWLGMASGARASVEVSRVATGRKNGLCLELYGTEGALTFDLERLNELHVTGRDGGFERILVTEPTHPYVGAWWPPGHTLGWDHTFTHQASELLCAIAAGEAVRPSFDDGLAVQRTLAAVEDSARDAGRRIHLDSAIGAAP